MEAQYLWDRVSLPRTNRYALLKQPTKPTDHRRRNPIRFDGWWPPVHRRLSRQFSKVRPQARSGRECKLGSMSSLAVSEHCNSVYSATFASPMQTSGIPSNPVVGLGLNSLEADLPKVGKASKADARRLPIGTYANGQACQASRRTAA